MSKINYVTREDGIPEMFSADLESDPLDIEEILYNYPYITDSMDEEGFFLSYTSCIVFDELVYEDKVVGFATFDILDETVLLLSECYILPEFRGNRLFFNEISKMLYLFDDIGFLEPNQNLIELLLDYSYAKNITDDIVASAIDLYFYDSIAKTNGVDLSGYNSVASHFYDTSIHSTVFVDKDIVIYHTQLENDFKRFGPRKKLTDDYFNNITDLFSKNLNEYLGLVYELKDELPEVKMGHDVIIGHGDGLSELLQGFVDNNLASYEKMLEIKKQLVREYESGQITDDTIEERFTVLLLDYVHEGMSFDDFENFLDSFDSDDEESETVKGFFDLAGDNKELKEDIFNAMLSHDEDKFEKAINNAIDDDDEFSKRFYDFIDEHEDLNSDARFDDFKNFLDSSDSNEDTEIVEDFFDLIGDNEELRDNLFSAVMSDDENKFEELIFNALNDDEDFSGRFFDFVEEYEDEDDFDDDYIDLNDLNLNFNSPFPIAEMMWDPVVININLMTHFTVRIIPSVMTIMFSGF